MKQKKEISEQASAFMMFLSGVLFALGGVCIRYIPWSPMSINGARSIYSVAVLTIFLLLTKHRLVVNRSVLLGAFFMCTMMTTYVIANKLTTAANAIVLQFTAPIFVIVFFSFNAGSSRAVFDGFSLQWYAELFEDELILQSLYYSIVIAVLSRDRNSLNIGCNRIRIADHCQLTLTGNKLDFNLITRVNSTA